MADGKRRSGLTICAISRNEERDLPHFLANVLPLADEVVIVDDGSDDRTKEIAANAGEKVKFISHPMGAEKHFAKQRNVCISHATKEWLLHMDIDERITPAFYHELCDAISDPDIVAYRYRRLNYFIQRPVRYGGWGGWNRPQLARKGFHAFIHPIHEVCEINAPEEKIGQFNNVMLHLTDEKVEDRFRKSVGYSIMVADQYVRSGKKILWYHLLIFPPIKFLHSYFLKGGFRDGAAGFIFCLQRAVAVYQRYAIAWNIQNEILRDTLEKELQGQWKTG